jgi:hypothetical protein
LAEIVSQRHGRTTGTTTGRGHVADPTRTTAVVLSARERLPTEELPDVGRVRVVREWGNV